MESLNIREILSKREYEIMVLVSAGKVNKDIAAYFKCELCTIKKHLQNIFPKLGVKNRTEASIRFMEITGKLTLQS